MATLLSMGVALAVLVFCRRRSSRLFRGSKRSAERIRIEQALPLGESELLALLQRQHAILEHIPAGVFLKDTAGRYVAVNTAYLNMLPPQVGDPVGKTVRDVFPPDVAEALEAEERQVRQEKKVLRKEQTIAQRDGRVVQMVTSLAPAFGEKGEVVGVVGVGFDVTEQKRIEAELLQTRQQAEKVGAELARQAEELETVRLSARRMVEDLQITRRTAEAAYKAKGEFLARMSHEIRTPLNGILGMADLVLATELTAEQQEYLEMLHQSAEALASVIDNILDFSKIEAGKLEVKFVPFSLHDCLVRSLDPLAVRAASKGLELVVSMRHDVPDALVGDPYRLGQVLLNLIGNAIKFTETGEVVLTVEVSSRDDQEVYLHFVVADTGIGIPHEKQVKIFEAFSQGSGSMTRKYGGTGLGLPISDQLVRMMGGRIWVESKVGKGSKFHFTALCGLTAAPTVAADAAALSGVDVLVVDDNASGRASLCETLTAWGARPVPAESGSSAMEILGRAKRDGNGKSFRLVLLDADMPGMTGMAVLEGMAGRCHPVPAVVMMLPAHRRERIARCRELGAKACVVKPVLPQELLDALRSALGAGCYPERQAETPPGKAAPAGAPAPLRILVAEDDEVNRLMATRMLQKQGHGVRAVFNGREALAAMEQEPFDLILMDLEMPEMGGFEVTAAIREREIRTGGHVPILAMTAHVMEGDRQRCLDGGMDGYLAKPVNPQQLFEAIEGTRRKTMPTAHPHRPESPDKSAAGETMDLTAALERMDGDLALLREVAVLFLETCPGLLDQIRGALAGGNTRAAAQLAHALRGSVSNFSAPGVYEAAVHLHAVADQGNLDGAKVALLGLEDKLTRLQKALSMLVAGQVPCKAEVT
jgi:PAS domain S-box-containing protein